MGAIWDTWRSCFDPHADETLAQVAQTELEYVRLLAITAQRPDVGVAAATGLSL
jgi:hypothetical protein